MLQRIMMHSNKGGHMLTIAVGFLIGTVALMVMSAFDR